jgi:nucleoside-diphosphate-sugar epimerase
MPEAQRILVIGGNGFIGRNLVDLLVEADYAVTVAGRSGARYSKNRVRSAIVDVADPKSVDAAVGEADVVYDLAMGGGDRWSDFERDFITGTRNVAEACLRHHVQRLIYTSSTAALYLGRRGAVNEAAGTDSKPQSRAMYSRAKIAAERVLTDIRQKHGLPVVIVRPGVVVGLDGIVNHSGVGYWPADLCCIGWNRGNNPLPFVLVRDVAQALFSALDAPGIDGMEFNLVGDVRPTAREYVARLAEAALRNYRYYPQWPWKLQFIEVGKWLLKVAARKPENPFPSYRDLKSRGLVSRIDCSAAKRFLNWTPNSDVEVFYREAVQANLRPFMEGDLRQAPAGIFA